ncbi:MAG TPA: SRPBCC family protein [Blastocatellia bacterium]
MAEIRIKRGARLRDGRDDGVRGNGFRWSNEEKIARGLGWFGIGLGLAQIAAPRSLAKLIGVRGDHSGLFRALGAREIASGVGSLARRRPGEAPNAFWAWSRVGGYAIGLALLGAAYRSKGRFRRPDRDRIAVAMSAVAGVAALDLICSQRISRRNGANGGAIHVAHAVTINRSPEELYRFWRDLQNLPRFMKHLESVRETGNRRLHWVAKAPAGRTVEWDAEITEDRPNELIAWRSLEGGGVGNVGSVRFDRAPDGRGSIVRVEMRYSPPAGAPGATVAKLFGENPEWQVKDDLRRFKQVMETGEIITTEGQPAGRASSTSRLYDQASRSRKSVIDDGRSRVAPSRAGNTLASILDLLRS